MFYFMKVYNDFTLKEILSTFRNSFDDLNQCCCSVIINKSMNACYMSPTKVVKFCMTTL